MDAKTEIAVTLTAEQWNIVLDVLADGRYRMVSPIIQKIYTDCRDAEDETVKQEC